MNTAQQQHPHRTPEGGGGPTALRPRPALPAPRATVRPLGRELALTAVEAARPGCPGPG